MCVEPGHDLTALPAVVLTDLVERGSVPWLVCRYSVDFLIFSSVQTSSVVKMSSRTIGLDPSSRCLRLTGRALLPSGADLAPDSSTTSKHRLRRVQRTDPPLEPVIRTR
jgi:hypothetical protein